METLAQKRKMVLANVQAPAGVVFDGAAVVYSVEDPANEMVEAPFFGGYMEDMLEDMGVVGKEEAEEQIIATA